MSIHQYYGVKINVPLKAVFTGAAEWASIRKKCLDIIFFKNAGYAELSMDGKERHQPQCKI
jgi:hypothetical protein